MGSAAGGAHFSQQALHFLALEAPLLANLDTLDPTVVEHTIDRDAVYFEKFDDLSSGKITVHTPVVSCYGNCYVVIATSITMV